MNLQGSPPPCLCLRRPTARPPQRPISSRPSPQGRTGILARHFPLLNHTSAPQSSLRLYFFGKHQETSDTYRKLAPFSTQASPALAPISTNLHIGNYSPNDRSPFRWL